MILTIPGVPEGYPKKSLNFNVPKAVPLTARMENTLDTFGQQTMDIHSASQTQVNNKEPSVPSNDDDNGEEGSSTRRFVSHQSFIVESDE